MTDVWLSLESLGPFTLSSCQTEERNHYLACPLSLPIPCREHSRKGSETQGCKYEQTKTDGHGHRLCFCLQTPCATLMTSRSLLESSGWV